MGEVYRARDTKLNRDVAIKVLLAGGANDRDRLARFQREAQALASLNHSNIAQIHGLADSAGVPALVMELVEGPTLADRIAHGAIPFEEALPIAKQIADALEAAHEKGVIHRDLKPANIKVTPDGTVKVLDFGLAKMFDAGESSGAAGLTLSPTLSVQGTFAGTILGTAAYMSPEQARGRPVDKRTDIWAFGCVLYEMLTGRPTFETGETISDAVAAILTHEPDWTKLPPATPIAIRTVLRHCLEKDRKRRLADIADARLEIDEARNEAAPVVSPSTFPAHSRRREFLWATAALVFFVTTAALGLRTLFNAAPEAAMVRFEVAAPQGARIDRTSTALAPDGRRVAFVATFESKALLWVRPLDASSAQPIPGTEDASRPFWSPDGQHIAFFAQGKIKRVAATGGPVQVLCSLPSTSTYNGTWNDGGVILFAPNDQGPVLRVPAAGGQPTPATELNASLKETRHSYPNFLPDGRHFLYLAIGEASRGTYVGTLDSNERQAIPGIVSEAKYSTTGYLMFLRDASLMAQRFDINRLELSGEAVQIAEQLGNGPLAPFSASMNGAISYVAGSVPNSSLVWFDRAGKPLTVVGPSGEYRNLELSPDDRFVAFERGSPADVWVLDLQRGLTSRFTSNAGVDSSPVWSPDGRTIAFTTDRDGQGNIYERAFGVVGEDTLLLKTGGPKTPTDWSRDGRYLAYVLGLDIWAVPMSGDRQPLRITETPFSEKESTLSPDGRWIAYASTESGRFEVYIQSFPKPGIKQQVSTTGGIAPRWKRDGTELLYLAADGKLMAASANPRSSSLELNTPSPLFQTSLTFATTVDARIRAQYDISIDGRFLMGVTPAEAFTHINVILNWSAGQRR